MNYKNMGTSDRGKAHPPQQQPTPSTPFSLARLQSGGVTCAEKLQKSRVLKRLLREQKAAGRVYGGFSSSDIILSKQGLLKGKSVASHLGIASKENDQTLKETRVVIDGKLITGAGLSSAIDFSLAIVNKLFGEGRVRSLVEGIVYEYVKS